MNTDTKQIQNDLAIYCKSGEYKPLKGVLPERVKHYRRLVFNVVKNTLEQAYPLTYDILGQDKWDIWVYEFFKDHAPQSSQVWKLPMEFYEWAVENNMHVRSGLPYLNDLLLFEWMEIEVYTMQDMEMPEFFSEGDIFSDRIVVNPEYRLMDLNYPVHKIPAKDLSDHHGQYFVIAFREPVDKKVEFIELSIFYLFILERIINQKSALPDVLVEAVSHFKIQQNQDINSQIRSLFNQLISKGFILGFEKT